MAYKWQVTYQDQTAHTLDLSPGLLKPEIVNKTFPFDLSIFYYSFILISFCFDFFPSIYATL